MVSFGCVDNIESNVEVASARVERGNDQLRSAVSAKVCTCITSSLNNSEIIVLSACEKHCNSVV